MQSIRFYCHAALLVGTATLASPSYAFDGGSFGAGLAGGLIGGLLAGAAQPHYYYRERRVYARPRQYVRTPRYVAPRVAARAPVQDAPGHFDVGADTPWVLRTYHVCSGNMNPLSARAEHGFIKMEQSTRFVCGSENHPVTEIVYMSQSGYSGTDRIEYVELGRVVHTDFINVRDGLTQHDDTDIKIDGSKEEMIASFSGCGEADMRVRAKNGFARLVRSPSDACDGKGHKIEVYYRAPHSFEGEDTAVLVSSSHRPITYTITVNQDAEVASAPTRPVERSSSDEKALAELAAVVQAPPSERPAASLIAPAIAAPKPAMLVLDADGDVRGQCRMESCDFFKVQSSSKVGSTGNGQLFRADMLVWNASYPDGEFDKAPKHVGDKLVEQTYFFCSKTRPTAFWRKDNQWFSRDLRPGDKSDVTNANYDRYVEYYAVCHHQAVADPYNVSSISAWGYDFAPQPTTIALEDKKVSDPTVMVKSDAVHDDGGALIPSARKIKIVALDAIGATILVSSQKAVAPVTHFARY